MKNKPRQLTADNMRVIGLPAYMARQQLEKIRDLNNRAVKAGVEDTWDFYSALSDVKVSLGQIEILFVANGGDKTAKAVGKCADELSGAMNQLQRATQQLGTSPFININQAQIQGLVDYCGAVRFSANFYATAKDVARPGIQNKIAQAIADAKPLITSLYRSHKHNDSDVRVVAQMLITRHARGMNTRPAIVDILNSDPSLILSVFGVHAESDITEDHLAKARQLISRS